MRYIHTVPRLRYTAIGVITLSRLDRPRRSEACQKRAIAGHLPGARGSASFVATSSVVPTSSGEAITGAATPPLDAPGTVATWTTSTLAKPLDVAGVPTLQVKFSAPTIAAAQSAGPAGRLMLFAKLYDVDAAGNKVLVRDLVSAVRVPDVTAPVSITLPGVVHRFAAGHKLQLALAASDVAYKGTGLAGPVTVVDSAAAPNSLTLPVVAGAIPR